MPPRGPFSGNHLLTAVFALYFVSRCFGLWYFAPHNDETLYIQFAQRMADDWAQYKYLSVDGRVYGEYKDPLQYWLTSWTVNGWKNPLIGARIWSVMLGFCGLFFTQRLVARIWNPTAALITAVLVTASEYYLYFDSIAMAEVYVYGLGAAFLYFLYDGLISRSWKSGLLALLLSVALLLAKASGALWLFAAFFVPLLVAASRNSSGAAIGGDLKSNGLWMYAVVAAIGLAGPLLHNLILPFGEIRSQPVNSGRTRGLLEILKFPWSDWAANGKYYFDPVLSSEFSLLVVPILLGVVLTSLYLFSTENKGRWSYLVWVALYVSSSALLIVIAKAEFIRHYAMGLYWLYVPIAVALASVHERLPQNSRKAVVAAALIVLAGWKIFHSYVPLARWRQTQLARRETPAGWANGAGVMELIDRLSRLPPAVLVYDPQWGHPGTAIQIFNRFYPQLVLAPLNDRLMENLGSVYQRARSEGLGMYFVLDARVPKERPWVDQIIEHKELCAGKEVIEKRFRDEVFSTSSIVVCEVRA